MDPCEGAPDEVWDDRARMLVTHMKRLAVTDDGWVTRWSCPTTGETWVQDFPRSEEQGGGPRRLRREQG